MAINIDAEKKAYKCFITAGMTSAGACGLIGNLEAESDGFYSNRVEYLCIKRLKENGKAYTSESYTAAVDAGKISCEEFLHPIPGKQYGYGLAQWTSPGRKSGLYTRAKEAGKSIADEDVQFSYLLEELENNYSSVLKVLKTTNSIREASDVVLKKFEIPADTSESVCAGRAARGQRFYDTYIVERSEGAMDTKKIVAAVIEDAVGFAVGIATDNSHGYSQVVRSLYNIDNPKSFDCSSLVLTAFYYAFVKNGLSTQAEYLKKNCSYTGNMMNMVKCGFEVVATNQTAHAKMVRGDIELNVTHHTALALDANNIVHARSSEGTSDTKDGSGNEIRVQPWYLYSRGWTHRLRFTGTGIDFSGLTGSGNQQQEPEKKTDGGSGYMFTVGNVKNGSKGNDVKLLQRLLKSNGCKGADKKTLAIDGDAGTNTVYAIKTFQKKKGLQVDGIAGPATWKSILLR